MQINSWKICIFAPMKHLVIRNLGPLHEADIELKPHQCHHWFSEFG